MTATISHARYDDRHEGWTLARHVLEEVQVAAIAVLTHGSADVGLERDSEFEPLPPSEAGRLLDLRVVEAVLLAAANCGYARRSEP